MVIWQVFIWLFGKFAFGHLVSIHLVFCGILLLLFVVIHFGFLRYAHHFDAVPFGSLAAELTILSVFYCIPYVLLFFFKISPFQYFLLYIPNSFLAIDGVETGFFNRIPLWLFGMLY